MSIVKMKRLRLIAMRTEQEELLKILQRLGCVEISQPEADLNDPEWTGLSHPDSAALNEARDNGAALTAALAALKKYAPSKGGMFSARPVIDEKTLFDDAAYAGALSLAETVNSAQRRIQSLTAERSKLRAQKLSLIPWLGLEVPLETTSTDEVIVQFGTVPSRMNWEQFVAAMGQAAPPAQLIPASSDSESHYLLFLCHRSAAAEANEVLKEYSFSAAVLKGWQGTAAANDKTLDGELDRIERELGEEEAAIAACGPRLGELQRAIDRSTQEIRRQEAGSLLLDTGTAFYLDGWVPANEEAALAAALAPFTCVWETSEPTEEEIPHVPVKLKNNWFTKPLNMVTDMYVYPAYNGLDPNPLMAPFFILYFGVMMADMAYGLLMLLGGWLLVKKLKAKGTMGHMGGLMLLCGGSTFLFGALTGGFFGDFIPQLAKLIDPESTFQLPYLFSPLEDTLTILIASLVAGFIQIATGMIISIVYKTKNGDFIDALFSEISWFIIMIGAALAIFGIGSIAGFPVVLIVGALMLILGGTRNARGFGKVTGTIGIVYNGISGYFSDILSYARVMALMLSGAVIAQVFNTLGSVTGSVVGFVIISLIGNALNFALNLLGCYVHDLRLQCLEYFGRFYVEGGRPFKPLSVNTKYVDMIKEEN